MVAVPALARIPEERRMALSASTPVTQKVLLTDKGIQALGPAEPGKRLNVWDAATPHLCVRVTDRGAKSFVVVAPMMGKHGKKTAHFIVLGRYPALSLKAAREKVPGTLALMAEGKHPKHEAKKVQADTFSTGLDDFLVFLRKKNLRTVANTESALRRGFLGQVLTKSEWQDGPDPVWRHRPLSQITRGDIIKRLEQIEKKWGKYAARHALASVRRLFNWAFDRERIETLPILRLSDKNTLGIKGRDMRRQRVLSDEELRDIWSAAEEFGYPFGTLVRVLLLSGQRRSEWQLARGDEIDVNHDLLTVPPDRFKMGVAHEVPYGPKVAEILEGLPTSGTTGPIFTNDGSKPIKGLSNLKSRFDNLVNRRRSERNEEPLVGKKKWVLHDLRRTARTRLSDLGVESTIAELVIGHAQPGLHETYNLSSHRTQKREALAKWERLLLSIVGEPAPTSNVVTLRVA